MGQGGKFETPKTSKKKKKKLLEWKRKERREEGGRCDAGPLVSVLS
jgi:hypothetical protein